VTAVSSGDLRQLRDELFKRYVGPGCPDVPRRVSTARRRAARWAYGVGVGLKEIKGLITTTDAVRLYVPRKLPRGELPPSARLPESIDGIPLDIVGAAPPLFCTGSAPKPQERVRPLMGGVSAAHFDVFDGTLGWFAHSLDPNDDQNEVFLLSNNHVFADTDDWRPDDPIHQPSIGDNPNGGIVGYLRRAVRLRKGGGFNRVDAAIAALAPGIEFTAVIAGIGAIAGATSVKKGDTVQKCGRSSGITAGMVVDESSSIKILLGDERPFTYRFEDVFVVKSTGTDFVLPGDSGALVITGQRAVGLVVARFENDAGVYGLCCHIDT
jgi:hypothetical protein